MRVEVYHAVDLAGAGFAPFASFKARLENGGYYKVADDEYLAESVQEAMELAYCNTQNIDDAWHPDQRSTSTGDVVVVDGTAYIVATIGFECLGEVNIKPSDKYRNAKEVFEGLTRQQ